MSAEYIMAGGNPNVILCEQEDALHPLALEGVGGGTGLVGPAPQGRRPGLPDGPGHLQNLPLALHGAGPGGPEGRRPAHRVRADERGSAPPV
mgnify:CR=1 FL=1